MNFVSRKERRVVIRQVPIVLLLVMVLFSAPMLAFSLLHIFRGTDAEGKYFTLLFGIFMIWVFLEFVATRERVNIDLEKRKMVRTVSGLFRKQIQKIDLKEMKEVGVELPLVRGRRRQFLYMYGTNGKHLLNSPAKVYIDHRKMGRLLSEVTMLPYRGEQEI